MKFIISKTADINYLSKIVNITNFAPHPNEEYTKLKIATIDGFHIAVSTDMGEGVYVYFPVMSQINGELLSYLNLYRETELNRDSEKKGFFEKNGRVKGIRLGGAVSEGFLLPIQDLFDWIMDSVAINMTLDDVNIGDEFDAFEHNGKQFWISKKFIIPIKLPPERKSRNEHRNKKLKKFNRLIDGQFKFHYDTILIKKEPYAIKPDDIIHISSKWHGTSVIVSRVLCKTPKTRSEKLLSKMYKLLKGRHYIYDTEDYFAEYDYIYSSRTVVKNANINPGKKYDFYGVDVWKYAFDYLKPYLIKGMSIYAEIVGYLPNGQFIQKSYDYGCRQPRHIEDYKEGTNFKVMIYRITLTNEDGVVHEFSPREVQIWCKNNNLKAVTEFYYGLAGDLYPDLDKSSHWCENFIERLADDKNFFMEMNSPDCINKVPHEGIVIKIDDMKSRAWKLKCFKFINKEQELLDKGITNIEDSQSQMSDDEDEQNL